MSEILGAVRAVCEHGMERQPRVADSLRQILWALDGLGELRPAALREPEVVRRHLGGCRALARDALAAQLVAALVAEPETVAWRFSAVYDAEPAMADFLTRYAVAVFFGPDRFGGRCPYSSDRATVGVSLQAPDTHYPAHAHAAVEVYFILAGGVDWQQGDRVWRRKVSGDFVLHRAHEPHAMRTGGEPLLALFTWVSDLMSDVYLTEAV